MTSALAIVCVRNEAIHLERCIQSFNEAGIEVHLIDNDSTDGGREIAQSRIGEGVLGVERLPWTGSFSLTDQLRAKRRVIEASKHDWIIHADADEWLCSPVPGQSLLQGIRDADAAGYNCMNFLEMVFVPLDGQDYFAPDYARRMQDYYFFQPKYPRLIRSWRRDSGMNNLETGGHRLRGEDQRRFPVDFILRHYIVLSESHARRKYGGRTFSDEDLASGWHRNRRNIGADRLRVKPHSALRRLGDPSQHHLFDLTAPTKLHFWEW